MFQCFPDFPECKFLSPEKNNAKLFFLIRRAFQLIFMVLASVLATSNAVIIDCSYSTNDYNGSGPVYSCSARVNSLDNNEAITAVTDSTGSADPTLQTSDVKWLNLVNNGDNFKMDHFPSNMATIFPDLIGIDWIDGNLKTLSPSDLSPYPNLIFLHLGMNMIRKLDGNTFQNNRKLQFLELSFNNIQEIGPGLLNGLNNLTNIVFYTNICTGIGSQFYLNPPYNTLADVQRDLDFVCGPSTRTEPSGPCDPCLANCTARAGALQIRADAVTESVYAPWYYKMRAFFKAVTLW